jgi:hypothetical protein
MAFYLKNLSASRYVDVTVFFRNPPRDGRSHKQPRSNVILALIFIGFWYLANGIPQWSVARTCELNTHETARGQLFNASLYQLTNLIQVGLHVDDVVKDPVPRLRLIKCSLTRVAVGGKANRCSESCPHWWRSAAVHMTNVCRPLALLNPIIGYRMRADCPLPVADRRRCGSGSATTGFSRPFDRPYTKGSSESVSPSRWRACGRTKARWSSLKLVLAVRLEVDTSSEAVAAAAAVSKAKKRCSRRSKQAVVRMPLTANATTDDKFPRLSTLTLFSRQKHSVKCWQLTVHLMTKKSSGSCHCCWCFTKTNVVLTRLQFRLIRGGRGQSVRVRSVKFSNQENAKIIRHALEVEALGSAIRVLLASEICICITIDKRLEYTGINTSSPLSGLQQLLNRWL